MRFLKADKLFDGTRFLPSGSVLAVHHNGSIEGVVNENELDKGQIEVLEGILTPGFVNAHCHLELSHLKNKIEPHKGLVDFALGVIKTRHSVTETEQLEAMLEADKAMLEAGIVLVGDISNTALSSEIKANSPIFYHTFVELIGLNPTRAEQLLADGEKIVAAFHHKHLSASLSPHAPYSTSLELIKRIGAHNALLQAPASIHNQEAEPENTFLQGKHGDFNRLYQTLGISIDWFHPKAASSFQYYKAALHPNVEQILVHNTFMGAHDIQMTEGLNIHICFCPNANLYIEGKLPCFEMFNKDTFCIGTDSLASNHQLDVLEELNIVSQATHFPDECYLRAITSNGAKALKQDAHFGSFSNQKRPGVNLIRKENNTFRFCRRLA